MNEPRVVDFPPDAEKDPGFVQLTAPLLRAVDSVAHSVRLRRHHPLMEILR